MPEDMPGYRSYLMRLWRADTTGGCAWRAVLEDPHTGERWGFACLEQLFVFLTELTERDLKNAAQPPDAVGGTSARPS